MLARYETIGTHSFVADSDAKYYSDWAAPVVPVGVAQQW